jgi:O-antigen/teichoic acid export membrane protein
MAKTNWIQKGSYALLANVVFIGFAFLTFMLLVRIYPPKTFGVWVMFLTITSFAEMTRIGLIQNGLIKFISAAGSTTEKAEYLTAGFVLNIVATVILSLLLIIAAKGFEQLFDTPHLSSILYVYPLYALIFGTVKFLEFVQTAHHDFKGILLSNFIYGCSFTTVVFVLWLKNLSIPLWYLVVFQALSAFLALLFSYWYARKYLVFSGFKKQRFFTLFHFGKYVFGTNFSSMLFNRMDTLMLGLFTTPVIVALYNIPTRINNYLDVPLNSIAQIIYPKISERYAKEGISAVRYLYERSVGLLLAISIPLIIVTAVFSRFIVWLLAGNNYLNAAPFVTAFAIMSLLKPYGRIMGLTLDAIGKPKLNFNLLLFSLIINFTLNLLFIPPLGITGAVIGTFSAVWIAIIIGQFIVRKYVPVNYWHPFIYMIRFYGDGWRKIKQWLLIKSIAQKASVSPLKNNQSVTKNYEV